jgi:hypothetical protein
VKILLNGHSTEGENAEQVTHYTNCTHSNLPKKTNFYFLRGQLYKAIDTPPGSRNSQDVLISNPPMIQSRLLINPTITTANFK